jgi:RHS repeat-associated protein
MRFSGAGAAGVLVLATLSLSTLSFADTTTSSGERFGEGATPYSGLAQAPEANLYTGALTTRIPIAVPPGRKNMTPTLALEYSSADGPSPYGHGWSLPIGQIARTTKWGVPNCANPHFDDFVLMMPGSGAAELVEVSAGTKVYRPEIEQSFTEVRFIAGNVWEARDRSGMLYTFGKAGDPDEGRLSSDGEGPCEFTSIWGLTKIQDPNGNRVEIDWEDTATNGNQLLPKRISYGGANGLSHFYFVDFVWAPNDPTQPPQSPADPLAPPLPAAEHLVSYRHGVRQEMRVRLHLIMVSHELPSATPIRTYVFSGNHLGEARYQLTGAVVFGQNETAQIFAYSDWEAEGPKFQGAQPIQVPAAFPYVRQQDDNPLSPDPEDLRKTILDMNGDGLLDLLRASSTGWTSHFGYVEVDEESGDTIFGFDAAATPWSMPLNHDVIQDFGTNDGVSFVKRDVFDINGDGIPDYVDAGPVPWHVHLGRSTGGFDPTILPWWAPTGQIRRQTAPPGGVGSTIFNHDVVDLNGDGMPDFVRVDENFNWWVYRNNGRGFDASPLFLPTASIAQRHTVSGISLGRLFDMNGDGLPDAVRAMSGAVVDPSGVYELYQMGFVAVYWNNGQGFDLDPAILPVPAGSSVIPGTDEEDDWVKTNLDLFDINGDGLPDLVKKDFDDDTWTVLLNLGGRFEHLAFRPSAVQPFTEGYSTHEWPGPVGYIREKKPEFAQRLDMLDLNGDGLLDRVTAGAGAWQVELNLGTKPNLLNMMENGVGATNTIRYEPSTHFDHADPAVSPHLPFLSWVVTGTRLNDGQCVPAAGVDVFQANSSEPGYNTCIGAGSELITTVKYEDGLFAFDTDGAGNVIDREFRGFGRVTQTDVFGNATLTVFHQDSVFAGLVDAVLYFAGAESGGTLLRVEDNAWRQEVQTAGRVKVWLETNTRAQFDGTATPLVLQSYNEEPDDFGNVTQSWKQGTGIPHRVYIDMEYAQPVGPNAPKDRPSHATSWEDLDNSGTYGGLAELLEEKRFFYDYAQSGVALGNVTEISSRLVNDTEDRWITTQNIFDGFGNIIEVTGSGRSMTTNYNLDGKGAHLYPTQITEAGLVTETEYDYRFGKPKRRKGPNELVNGTAHEYEYHFSGRLLKEAIPEDTLTSPTVQYSYVFPVAPVSGAWPLTKVGAGRKQGEAASGQPPPRLWEYGFSDALGRTRYTETKRIVDGNNPIDVRSGHVLFDAGGNVRHEYLPYNKAEAPNGFTSYEYNLNGGAFTDPFGRVRKVTNPDGTMVLTSYFGPQTWIIGVANDVSVTYTDGLARTTRTETRNATLGVYSASESEYDGLGRMTASYLNCAGSPNMGCGANDLPIKTMRYDTLGRRIETWDRNSGIWQYGYDNVGNLRWQDDPKENQHMEFCYDVLDRPTLKCSFATDVSTSTSLMACGPNASCPAESEIHARYEYGNAFVPNAKGRLTRVSDVSGIFEVLGYDVRGRQTAVRRTIDVDGDLGYATTSFEYNHFDQVTRVVYPDGETVETVYDAVNQPIGLGNHWGDVYVDAAHYDLFGRLKRLGKGNGIDDFNQYYDHTENNRLQAIGFTEGPSVRHSQTYTYNDRGQVASIDHTHGSSGGIDDNGGVFQYDFYGRLTSFDPAASGLGTRTNQYDHWGNMTHKDSVTMTFDPVIAPHKAITVKIGGATPETQAYDGNGNRSYVYSGGTSAKGVGTFNPEDRLSMIDPPGAGANVYFRYDAGGQQRVKIVDYGTPAQDQVTRYYGPQVEVVEQGTSATAIKSYFFAGQRVAQRVVPSAAWQASPLALGPGDLIEVAAAWIGKPVLIVGLTPAARNTAAAATTVLLVALFLMPAGRRRRAVAGMRLGRGRVIGVTLLFGVGSLPLPILVRPAQAQCTGCNCPTPTPVPGSYLRFLHYDHINSPLMITDEDGDVVEQIRYYPYGAIRARLNGADQAIGAPDPEDVRYEFTGYEAERNSGLLYANARYYDPVVGSFLTHDPAGQFANPYTYTGWDPVNLTDPSGESVELFLLALGVVAAVAQSIANGGDFNDAIGAAFFALGAGVLAAGTIGPIGEALAGKGAGAWVAVRSVQLASGGYGVSQAFRHDQYIVGGYGAALFALGLVGIGASVDEVFAKPSKVPALYANAATGDGITVNDAQSPHGEVDEIVVIGEYERGVVREPLLDLALGLAGFARAALYGSFARVIGNQIGSFGIRTVGKWRFGSHKAAEKFQRQMQQRGWTEAQIDEAMGSGTRFPAPNNVNPANSATRYVHPDTGRSVVIDDVTNEVLHVGGDGFKY